MPKCRKFSDTQQNLSGYIYNFKAGASVWYHTTGMPLLHDHVLNYELRVYRRYNWTVFHLSASTHLVHCTMCTCLCPLYLNINDSVIVRILFCTRIAQFFFCLPFICIAVENRCIQFRLYRLVSRVDKWNCSNRYICHWWCMEVTWATSKAPSRTFSGQ